MRFHSEIWFGALHLAVVVLLWLAVVSAVAAPLANVLAAPLKGA